MLKPSAITVSIAIKKDATAEQLIEVKSAAEKLAKLIGALIDVKASNA